MANEYEKSESQDFVKFNRTSFHQTKGTYIWKVRSKQYPFLSECTDDAIYKKGEPFEHKRNRDRDIVIIELVKSPDAITKDRYFLGTYFKEVFEESAFIKGHYPKHKFDRLVLPLKIYNEILSTIKHFGLLKIQNLLFETVAIAQGYYANEVTEWDVPEKQHLIKSAKEESKKVIQVIERLENKSASIKSSNKSIIEQHLDHIKFVYQSEDTIKIEHDLLCKEFIKHMKDYYDNLSYKNWKKELSRYSDQFKENTLRGKFKYRLAKSYYNLFEKSDLFKPDEKLSSNQLMLCIVKLLEYSMIPVGVAEEKDDIKIKHVRNWITRYDLKPMVTYTDLPANIDRLKRYFDPNFIDITSSIKKADALSVASYICDRFNIPYLLPELLHISACILESNKPIWYKLISNAWSDETQIPEYSAFNTIIDSIKSRKKISSIKITFEGEEGEQKISQRLPLFLIEEGLREHYLKNKVEYDVDNLPISFDKEDDKEISIRNDFRFSLPHERYLVKLTHSLFNYLKDHIAVEEKSLLQEEKYYEIIAVLFMKTRILLTEMLEEPSTIKRIKHWHLLNAES